MKKKTEHDVGVAETSAVPDVSTPAAPPPEGPALEPMGVDAIRSRILTVRGVQVMLAPDLADLYQVETRSFNQAVKRNIKRFPENFRFQLTKAELDEVITNCDNPDRLRFSPQTPYAFTEQGIAMLSGVLNSDVAVQVSIRIMNTFVAMRKALASIAPLLARIDATERRQIADQAKNDANQVRNEERFKLILDAMQDKRFPPQKVFYDGQIYDAFEQMKKFVRMARTDDKAVLIHVGASLNHLGKKCFAFSSMDKSNIPDIVAKI